MRLKILGLLLMLLAGCGTQPRRDPPVAAVRPGTVKSQEESRAELERLRWEADQKRKREAAERERQEKEAEQRRLAQQQEQEAKLRQAQAEEDARLRRFFDELSPKTVSFEQKTLLGQPRSAVIRIWGHPDDSTRTMTGTTEVETIVYHIFNPFLNSRLPSKTYSFVLVNGVVERQSEY